MPAKFFSISKKANKNASRLPLKIHHKVDLAFDAIKENPIIGEKLHGELEGYYKYRIGNYRIIYTFDSRESVVTVVKIEHRQGVYR